MNDPQPIPGLHNGPPPEGSVDLFAPRSAPPRKSIEQHCRDLLLQAMDDHLVTDAYQFWDNGETGPECRSSGELSGMANMLNDIIAEAQANHNGPPPEGSVDLLAPHPLKEGFTATIIHDPVRGVLLVNVTDGVVKLDGWFEPANGVTLPAIKTQAQLEQLLALLGGLQGGD